MASSFTLPSSTPPAFTHPPPSSLHPHPLSLPLSLSLSFPYHPSPPLLQVVNKSSNNALMIPRARSKPADPATNEGSVAKCSTQEQKWTHEGLITESLPNGMFRVRLDNQDVILGYVSGKIRSRFIKIVMGDRVKIEVSRYDSSKGRIVFRMRDQDTKEMAAKGKGKKRRAKKPLV